MPPHRSVRIRVKSKDHESRRPSGQSQLEYVTIRWAPKENTLIRPGVRVEFIGSELRKLPRPDRADDRAFYLNTAINGLAKEGFEVVAMTSDEIVLKRALSC